MYSPSRRSCKTLDPTLMDVLHQAVHEGRTVEIVNSDEFDQYLGIRIDGVDVVPIVSETFAHPLDRMQFSDEANELVAECLDQKHKRFLRDRKERLSTDSHAAAEGVEM